MHAQRAARHSQPSRSSLTPAMSASAGPACPAQRAQCSDTRESHFETKLPLQAVRTQKRGIAAKARLAALGQPGAAKLPPLLDFGPYRLRSPELSAAGRGGASWAAAGRRGEG